MFFLNNKSLEIQVVATFLAGIAASLFQSRDNSYKTIRNSYEHQINHIIMHLFFTRSKSNTRDARA